MVIAHLKVADTTFTVDADIAPQLQGWTCYWCKGKAQIVVETGNVTQKMVADPVRRAPLWARHEP
jgi:hypothetical protein